jgi:hypothetical protein
VFKLHSLNFPYFLKTTESKGEENYIYIYREREREKEREKQIYMCVYNTYGIYICKVKMWILLLLMFGSSVGVFAVFW